MQALGAQTSVTTTDLLRQKNKRWRRTYAAAMFVGLFVAAFSLLTPHFGFPIAMSLYILGIGAIVLRPVTGVFFITFFGVMADDVSAPWWPFLKNASSGESILFVSNGIIMSPMEGYLVLTTLATLGHVALRRVELSRPPLLGPLLVFMGFIILGFVWGVGRGGNVNIGLWEIRPFFALLVLYLLATTLIQTRTQTHLLGWTVMAALFFESMRTIYWVITNPDTDLYDSLVEHSAAAHMNLLFVAAILAWLIRRSSVVRRLALPLASLPVLFVYLVSERRSAIASLVFAGVIVFIFLAAHDPRRFIRIGPVFFVLFAMYTAAFWGVEGPLGFPAQVVKSQIAPDSQSAADRASDTYRTIEHLDILATIHRTPVMGIGFGQQYDRPFKLPDISHGFIWWEYITHNAILWIWLKAGFLGFVAMFNLHGRGIYFGMRTALRVKDPTDTIMAATAMLYIPIYLVFSYVDISWGTQSMILLAVSLAIIAKIDEFNPETPDEPPADEVSPVESESNASQWITPAIGP